MGFERCCPVCGQVDSRKVLELEKFQFYSDSSHLPKRFDVIQRLCRECYTVYQSPGYSDYGFGVLFSEAGQSYGSLAAHTDAQIGWLVSKGLMSAGNSLLDVGCFDGAFLSSLPDHIVKLGVDIDRSAIERGRVKYADKSIIFVHGDFETFDLANETPDVITMFHVLEHLPRPLDVLRRLRKISKPETGLVVEVPVLENGLTNDINGFFSVQHMTHFSKSSLAECMNAAGWNIHSVYETESYNGYRVLAYPAEVNEAADVTGNPDDVASLNACLANWYASLKAVEDVIKNISNHERFVVWGAGAHTEFLYQVTSFFSRFSAAEFIVVDSDPAKTGTTWRGLPVYLPSACQEYDWSKTGLVISSYSAQEPIYNAALAMGIPESSVYRFYKEIHRY